MKPKIEPETGKTEAENAATMKWAMDRDAREAGPELLAALQAMIAAFDAHAIVKTFSGGPKYEACAMAIAAIDMARGGAK